MIKAIKSTPLSLIPKGDPENIYPGYWMDGLYSTIIHPKGTCDLRITLNLNVPVFSVDAVFMVWH
jgi:hypothetical protein